MKRKLKFMRLARKILPDLTVLLKFVSAVIELVSKVANYAGEFFQLRVQLR